MSISLICPICQHETASFAGPDEARIGATCLQCRESLEAEKRFKLPKPTSLYDRDQERRMRFRVRRTA